MINYLHCFKAQIVGKYSISINTFSWINYFLKERLFGANQTTQFSPRKCKIPKLLLLFSDKPQFIDAIKEINFEVNSSNVFTINAKANPDITKYSWTKKGGREISMSSDQRISASGANLYLNHITEEDGGTYVVTAENSIGKSRKSFRVNVEYPPRQEISLWL